MLIKTHFWAISGPKLPFFLAGSSMVTSPSGKGVILIGGYNADISDYSNEIIELRGTSMTWVTLSQKLLYPRYGLVKTSLKDFQSSSASQGLQYLNTMQGLCKCYAYARCIK